jgi:hypothetical protein
MPKEETFTGESSEACAGVMFGFGFIMVLGVLLSNQRDASQPIQYVNPPPRERIERLPQSEQSEGPSLLENPYFRQ